MSEKGGAKHAGGLRLALEAIEHGPPAWMGQCPENQDFFPLA
jgi:hypothetical protein